MKCFICSNHFASVRLYKVHLADKHGLESLNHFSCNEEQCARTFPSWHSLQRHLHAKHSFSSMPQPPNNATDRPQDLDVLDTNDVEVSQNDENLVSDNAQTLNEASSSVCRMAISFISNLHENPVIPRNLVQSQVDEVRAFHSEIMFSIRDQLAHALKDSGPDAIEKCNSVLDAFETPFENLQTEYKRLKFFETQGTYIPPEEIVVTSREVIRAYSGKNKILRNKPVRAQYVPIRLTLKKVFELKNYLQRTIDYVTELYAENDTGVISNFVQGLLWKRVRETYGEKIVFPIFLYFDDFETSDPLSGHSNKLGGMYCSVPCIPPELQAKLKSVFLVLLFDSDCRKEAGNEMLFRKLIDDLEDLKFNGVLVNTSSGSYRVYFVLGLILGDNLGLHTILGFLEGFRANFPCRFCKCHRNDCQGMCYVNVDLLRNSLSYSEDLLLNSTETGIKEESVWNKLDGFHVTQNYCVDVMHDVLEGVCIYDFQLIIRNCLNSKYFTLDDLNFRIKTCKYLPDDSKPPPVKLYSNVELKFSFTAAEMLFFVRYFNVMVGSLVPESDLSWQLYLALRKIVCLVTSKKLQIECSYLLEGLVSEHHELYIALAGEPTLKPKHHHMLHYGLCMRMSGPLCLLWAMRFEAKHRVFKSAASTCASRVNSSLTFARRHQLVFSAQLLCAPSTSTLEIGPGDIVTLLESDKFQPCVLLPNFNLEKSYYSPNWIRRNGYDYQPAMIIIIDILDSVPMFAILKDLILDDSRAVFVVCKILEVRYFDVHKDAYCCTQLENIRCLSLDNIYDILPPSYHLTPDGREIVALRCTL